MPKIRNLTAALKDKKKKKSLERIGPLLGKMNERELKETYKFTILVKTYGDEARELFERIDKSAVSAEEHMRNFPPSSGAIALLVTEAQVRFKSEQAKKGATKKLAIDPRQTEKAFVRECWTKWQEQKPGAYKWKSDFAKDMLAKCEYLTSQKKIEDWCREWEKETAPS